MRLEVVDLPGDDGGGIENAVAAVDDMIVEGDHHQRWIRDDALQLAGVERPVLDGLSRAQRL
jgi:hypothetical protein